MSLSTGMSIVSPKSSFRRVHVRALTASGSLKFRLKGTSGAVAGARGRTHKGRPPSRPAPAVPHPARQGGLHVLLELGVLASQIGEVGGLVLVAVAGVHGLAEGHVGPGRAGSAALDHGRTPRGLAPGAHRGPAGRTKARRAAGGGGPDRSRARRRGEGGATAEAEKWPGGFRRILECRGLEGTLTII